ncbi:Glyoxalase/Bleomycin resistance protein/Dioxygenase superfamily protein [Sphingobium faniae]|nr:Glyoxalase/Bleomycin resistance protein/Dioxygenase superfamily protein [Sphingobium faniae]
MPPFNIFQMAYVTDDIDMAVQAAGAAFGIDAFQVNRDMAIETGQGIAIAHFALAFLGDTQIEVIQPAGGADDVYRQGVRARDGGLTFHHAGALITDEGQWHAVVAAIERSGEPVPVRGAFGDLMHYLYVDRRATLGHHLEYMWRTPAGAAIFDGVPRF